MHVSPAKLYCVLVTYKELTGFEEEDHDGCRCLHLPRCSCTGSASLLWSLTRYKRRYTLWLQEQNTTNMLATQCSRDFKNPWSSWAFKDATLHGQLALLAVLFSASSLRTASWDSLQGSLFLLFLSARVLGSSSSNRRKVCTPRKKTTVCSSTLVHEECNYHRV